MTSPRPIAENELQAALAIVLAGGGRQRAGRAQIQQFVDYLRAGGLRWQGWMLADRNGASGISIALRVPGQTAVLMHSPLDDRGVSRPLVLTTIRHAMRALAAERLHYAQCLAEPHGDAERALLAEAGFQFLTRLEYLERDSGFPWVEPVLRHEADWTCYSPERHASFAAAILASYQDSLDCPELSGFRPIDDVLASHRATGEHAPDLWELAIIRGEVAGCVLMSRVPGGQLLEVVYMGVTPPFRKRGVGQLLMRRVLERARTSGFHRVTLVMDTRNSPARSLYTRVGFGQVAQRDAFLYRWPNVAAADPREIM